MKNLIYIFILALGVLSCQSDDLIEFDNSDLVGKWKLTEAFISAGGPQYWVTVEDGEEFVFYGNGTFTSSKFSECAGGIFLIDSSKLILEFNCEGFESELENEEGFITYKLEYESNHFIATPTSGPICIEGCSYKYEKE